MKTYLTKSIWTSAFVAIVFYPTCVVGSRIFYPDLFLYVLDHHPEHINMFLIQVPLRAFSDVLLPLVLSIAVLTVASVRVWPRVRYGVAAAQGAALGLLLGVLILFSVGRRDGGMMIGLILVPAAATTIYAVAHGKKNGATAVQ